MYDRQPEVQQTRLPVDERSHARLLSAIVGKTGIEGNTLARLEGRRRAIGGNALRAAVLGANDGLSPLAGPPRRDRGMCFTQG